MCLKEYVIVILFIKQEAMIAIEAGHDTHRTVSRSDSLNDGTEHALTCQ